MPVVKCPNGHHIQVSDRHIGQTVKFPPVVVSDFKGKTDDVEKIVGVSDDLEAVAKCEAAVRQRFGGACQACQSNPQREAPPRLSAARSQPYYLDVTHPEANKGAVALALSKMLNISPTHIATIGDMPNDITMFTQSGVSIAMGQASEEVKKAATFETASSEEEGFAKAIEKFILTNA